MLENILLGIVSICTFISYFPQLLKCIKSKDRQLEDLSVSSWILWVVSSLSYTIYTFLCTDSFMLIFETCLELSFCIIIMIFAIRYREKTNQNEKEGRDALRQVAGGKLLARERSDRQAGGDL